MAKPEIRRPSAQDLAKAAAALSAADGRRGALNAVQNINAELARISRSEGLSEEERLERSKETILDGAALGYKIADHLGETSEPFEWRYAFEAALALGASHPLALLNTLNADAPWRPARSADAMFERARLLLLYGADPNRKDRIADSALHQACREGASARVFALIDEWGGDWDAPGARGETPRQLAASLGVQSALSVLEAKALESELATASLARGEAPARGPRI